MYARKYQKTIASILAMLLVAVMLCAVAGCKSNKASKKAKPAQTESTQTEQQDPAVKKTTLTVGSTTAKAGDKAVEVYVNVARNPGILGIDFDLFYDDTVMTLVDAESQLELENCVYTAPAYYRNPTTFLWDFQDANWTEDGAFLKLYFDIKENVPAGSYEIKIMYSYGDVFDADFEPIDVAIRNGNISIN